MPFSPKFEKKRGPEHVEILSSYGKCCIMFSKCLWSEPLDPFFLPWTISPLHLKISMSPTSLNKRSFIYCVNNIWKLVIFCPLYCTMYISFLLQFCILISVLWGTTYNNWGLTRNVRVMLVSSLILYFSSIYILFYLYTCNAISYNYKPVTFTAVNKVYYHYYLVVIICNIYLLIRC